MDKRILLALPVVLAVAACKPQQPAATPAANEPRPLVEDRAANLPPAGTDAVSVVDNTPAVEITAASGDRLDNKSLAGKFTDGESILELRADGDYVQTLHVAGSEIRGDGHWSAAGGSALLLDPNGKGTEDARFEVVSADTLKGVDGREFVRIK